MDEPSPEQIARYRRKLEYYRGKSEKHVRDIRSMLQTSPIDRETLARFIDERGLHAEWALVEPA